MQCNHNDVSNRVWPTVVHDQLLLLEKVIDTCIICDILQIDKEELEDARWFSRQDVINMLNNRHPERFFIPPEQAIAHVLIRTWVNMTSNL